MVKRILVTGGEGFIGTAFLRALVSEGHAVTSYGLARGNVPGVAYTVGDVCDLTTLTSAIRTASPDIVFHLAGLVHGAYDELFHVNVTGTKNVLEAFAGRVIFLSTSLVYHDCPVPFREDMVVHPVEPYPLTKLLAEKLCLSKRGTVVRLSVVYGPDQSNDMLISSLRHYLQDRKGPFVMTRGEQQRDFIYIDDVIHALVLLVDNEYSGVLNIGSGEAHTLLQVVQIVKGIVGDFPVLHTVPYRERELMFHVFDISKAYEVLRWRPSVEVDDGLRRVMSGTRR